MCRQFGFFLAGILCFGASAAVPRPWTPVKVDGETVSVWGRDYAFASNALPVSVKTQGRELLAGPMRIVCADEKGNEIVWAKAGSWVQEADEESATVCAWQDADGVAADVVARVEFDGMAKVSLALVPGPKEPHNSMKVSKAWLEIPFAPGRATLFNYSPASWSKLENTGVVKGDLAWPFRCAVWLGDEASGLCWFTESDAAFSPADPKRAIEVLPRPEGTLLRIRLSEKMLTQPTTWVFGLQATPVKPFPGRFNANHTVHAPQMGAGITIKRPEVWWTAQRAFPQGRIAETLDAAAKGGVKTVVFHEDWIPVQNNPTPRPDFKAIVDGCHARGMKVLVYQGYELSPLDPHWGDHHADWLAKTRNGTFVSYWFREPGQRDYRICYNNGAAETWLGRVKKAYDELGLDGVYLDGTIMPRACANERHGCGWRDADGKLHETYPFFAVRKMMRELYEFVEARGGRIDAHQSGYVCPATLAFAHSYWDGEQLAVSSQNIKQSLNLDAFRAEFMGRNHGVPCEFLAYEKPGWSYNDALAITLLHDVMVRPCGFASVPRLAPLWKALDDFGFADADWTPYWKNPVAVSPASVKASVYRRKGATLVVASNVSQDDVAAAEIVLPAGAKQAVDALSGRALEVRDGKVAVAIPSFRYVLIRMN